MNRPTFLREQIVGMAEDKSGRFLDRDLRSCFALPRDKLLSGIVKAVDVREYDQADGLESTEGVERSNRWSRIQLQDLVFTQERLVGC